jgi:hypothetical protein
MNMTVITGEYARLKGAEKIEPILCLATLIAGMILASDATLEDANAYYNELDHTPGRGGCCSCILRDRCLACIINR